jgi:hypothetical protein
MEWMLEWSLEGASEVAVALGRGQSFSIYFQLIEIRMEVIVTTHAFNDALRAE